MTTAEFDRLLGEESEHVEFKTGTGNTPMQESVVAFSNSDGGVIIVGVDPNGQVVGRELNQGTLDSIMEALRNVRDPGRYGLKQTEIGGKPVVVLSVARRVNGFSQTSNGRVLVRRGTFKVALFGTELRRLLVERSLEQFEDHDAGLPLGDASADQIDRLARVFGWSDPASYIDRLREQGLVLGDSDHLSIAGAAYLLDDPRSVLGKAYIEVLRYPHPEADYDRRVEIVGPLDQQVETATRFVAEELGHELVVLGLQRHEIPRLPLVVLREAIANAVAHRSYEAHGTSVRVEIRPDGVKVISPGGLPEPVTEQNIRDAQAARNLHMIRVLRRAGLAEDAGRGIDVMVDSMRGELLDPPTFRDLGHAVEVSLPVRSAVTPSERAWVREIESRGLIEAVDRMVLVHAARGERLTNARVRELIGLDSSGARLSLQRLRDAGLLVQHGRRGGATYSLADSLSAPAGLRLTPEELRSVLLAMAAEGPLSNAQVRLRTGLERGEALRTLDDLVTQGKLLRVGERRGTRYVLPRSGESGDDVPPSDPAA